MPKTWIIQLLITWFINALALFLTSLVIPAIKIHGPGAAFVASLVLGLLNGTVLRVLKLITFPITIVTLGLFLFVLNGAMLKMTSGLVQGFHVEGWWGAIIGGVILSIIQSILYFIYRRFD